MFSDACICIHIYNLTHICGKHLCMYKRTYTQSIRNCGVILIFQVQKAKFLPKKNNRAAVVRNVVIVVVALPL